MENFTEADKYYSSVADSLGKGKRGSDIYHNMGNSLLSQKKYAEAIEAFKNSLRRNPGDMETKSNLAYAQKMLQEQQQNQDKKNEPKPQPSKLTRKDAEEKLKALMQQEKNLQDKLHKINPATATKPEKDW